jgi:hypothetical protein
MVWMFAVCLLWCILEVVGVLHMESIRHHACMQYSGLRLSLIDPGRGYSGGCCETRADALGWGCIDVGSADNQPAAGR